MKIIHTADLHIGQVLYQWYHRDDEHDYYFNQLEQHCRWASPDALVISGDIFDIQQPSAAAKEYFNRRIAALHRVRPEMAIVITAGNHDSAARLAADAVVWGLAGITVVGHAPMQEAQAQPEGWQEQYVVKLEAGYIVALPYMPSSRTEVVQALLDYVDSRNAEGLPVVMLAHQAVQGCDPLGHSDMGNQRVMPLADWGEGYDYLALGHIHRPQTLGHPISDEHLPHSSYPAPVARYSGSALHVSCDERYPHSVSLVEIDHHGGTVSLTRLPTRQLRHFHILPPEGQPPAATTEEAVQLVHDFCKNGGEGYFRLRLDYGGQFTPDLQQEIYKVLDVAGGRVRFNPKHLWEGAPERGESRQERPLFEVADLQEMTNPLDFIRSTIDAYAGLDLESLEADFQQVEAELYRMGEADRSEKIVRNKKTETPA